MDQVACNNTLSNPAYAGHPRTPRKELTDYRPRSKPAPQGDCAMMGNLA